ncbi:venom peptide isomerase heavy chain-like [Toxorhynchites rutilus septentrionalis]|uniref:venom peptide isomerase heavy chain-like n=1 Tax=Toxorhynchites rutilus septentrionalis TaxID=329112 RepID=UPI0024785099|nr:venom peptide isomerase heavy chain-like [Toxorhynchites rutilus septentrionalis]
MVIHSESSKSRMKQRAIVPAVGVLLLVQLASGIQCGARQHKTRSLITNAFEVQPGDYPWHVAIYQLSPDKEYICGATLIGRDVIITSAHCTAAPGLRTARPVEDLAVQIGKHQLTVRNDHEQEVGLSSIIVHPGFRRERHGHDLALLITVKPILFGKFVQPACLPTLGMYSKETIGTIVGWGFTERNTISNVLRAAAAPIVSKDKCKLSNPDVFMGSLAGGMFCAGHRNGTNACNGDSGGGLFTNVRGRWYLLGVISFTAAKSNDENYCSSTDYTVFVNVGKYMKWIEENSDSSSGTSCTGPHHSGKLRKQYYVHNSREVTFFEAWRLCLSAGHKLATITSEEDSRLLEYAIGNSSQAKGPWFIGGTDLGNEGQFVWISTGQPIGYLTGYLNFSPDQPNNAIGGEHCLEVGRWGNVAWNDIYCDWKQRYICEFESAE